LATNHSRTEKPEKLDPKLEMKAELAPPALAAPVPPPAHPIVVERITHQDIPEICALFRRVWEPYLVGLPPEVQREAQPTPLEFTSGMERVTYFSARRDGRLVGVGGFEMIDGAGHLVKLCVDAEHRRKGIGSAILQASIEWARHAGAKSIWAELMTRYVEGGHLLLDRGFHEAGVLHKHYYGEDVREFEMIL
jgi:GNAT superfamily N-acetyltransferase